MEKRKGGSKKKIPAWLEFEKEVARLFELFGYDEVIHDTKVDGGQCDVVAKSSSSYKVNVVAECKHHSKMTKKVGVNEVNAFVHKVSNYRTEGKIDHGYLVTNSGFTSDARAALNDRTSNFIFLLTYDELIQRLFNLKNYLKDYIDDYDYSEDGERFVDLKLLNTTSLDQTILDGLPGDVVSSKDENRVHLVVSRKHLNKNLSFLDFKADQLAPMVKPIEYLDFLIGLYEKNKKADTNYEKALMKSFSEAVKQVADKKNEKMLHALIHEIPEDTVKSITWYPESVIDSLLNIWHEYGGDSQLTIYRKDTYRKQLRREILECYYHRRIKVKKEVVKIPPFTKNYEPFILNALKVEPGLMPMRIDSESEEVWTRKDELKNLKKHLQEAEELVKLKLLVEEGALGALTNFLKPTSDTNILVVIGDYGAGKTTLIRRLMRTLSEDKLENTSDPNFRIPLYITLKDYNKVPNMQSLIRLFLKETVEVDNVSTRTFKKLNEEGRFILLLDAFDEMLTQVSKADRRRCFNEISELATKNSKIILTGRPSYFNDFHELKENLELLKKNRTATKNDPITYNISCLQLMDEEQVELLLKKASPSDSENIFDLIVDKPSLIDLARRPVLASMIADAGDELVQLDKKEISARDIYEIYTNKWIEREEDKGEFRLLIHPDQKSTFVRYLAMQMYLSKSYSLHYSDLNKVIEEHFEINNMKEFDLFSHDIRTCSFLSRTDDGFYFFIHKSFLEYFVACEFERMEESPFADTFSGGLTGEIIDLLNFDVLPKEFSDLKKLGPDLEKALDIVREIKTNSVNAQWYFQAAVLRDIEKMLEHVLDNYNLGFLMTTKKRSNVFKTFEDDFNAKDFLRKGTEDDEVETQRNQSLKNDMKDLAQKHLTYFDLDILKEE